MASYLFTFALVTTAIAVSSYYIDSSSEEVTGYNQEMVELVKKMEIENIKKRILDELGIDKPQTFKNPIAHLSDAVIQKLVGNKEQESFEEKPDNGTEIYFFPVNSNFECQKYDISFCQRFEYKISPDVALPTSEFWVYKIKSWPVYNVTIRVLCSHSQQEILELEEFSNEDITMKWIFFKLSALNDKKLTEENITCEIETKGIEMDLHNLPFLKVLKNKDLRVRREIHNDTIKDYGCKLMPLNVPLEKLFGQGVIYPKVYQANICMGYCSHVNSNHDTLLEKFVEIDRITNGPNNETKCDSCWFPCCKPKTFKSLELIYWLDKAKGKTTQRNMPNMIISSCSCM